MKVKIISAMLLLGISVGVFFMQRGSAESDGAEVTKEHYLAYQAMTKGERLTAYGLELKAKHDKYERKVLNHEGKKKFKPNDYNQIIRGIISLNDAGERVTNKNMKITNVINELEKLRRSGRVTAKEGDVITERGPGGQNSGRIVVIEQDPNNSDILYAGASGGGIWKSTNMGESWTIINGNLPALPVSGIAISKSNSDKVFITLGDPTPSSSSISAFGTFVSENTNAEAVEWTQLAGTITEDNEFRDITQVAVHPNTTDSIIIAGTNDIWVSTDGGETFTGMFGSAGNVVWDIEVSPTDFNTILATVNGYGIWKSTDFGVNWTNVVAGGGRMEMDMSVSDPNIMYAQLESSSALGGIFRSNDMGDTWFRIDQSQNQYFNIFNTDGVGSGGQGWYDQSMEIDPRDPNIVYMGGIDIYKGVMNNADSTIALTRLTDGYGEFGYPHAHVDQHGLTIVKKGSKIYSFFGNDGGVFMSPDGGKSFQAKNIGINSMQFYTVDKKPGENVYGGGLQDNGSWVSPANPTATDDWWAPSGLGGDGFSFFWNQANGNEAFGTRYNNQMMRSSDGGKTFTYQNSIHGIATDGPFNTDLENKPNSPEAVYFGGGQGWNNGAHFTRSFDFGESFEKISAQNARLYHGPGYGPYAGFNSKLSISLANPNIIWAGDVLGQATSIGLHIAGIHVSMNAGDRFTETSSTLTAILEYPNDGFRAISGVDTHPTKDSTAYVMSSLYGRNHIARTTNLGKNWEAIGTSERGFPDVATHTVLVLPWTSGETTELWAGTEIGIMVSTDNGASWSHKSDFPPVEVRYLSIIDGQILVGTHGRGMWTIVSDESTAFGNYPVGVLNPSITAVGTDVATGNFTVDVTAKQSYASMSLTFNTHDTLKLLSGYTVDSVKIFRDSLVTATETVTKTNIVAGNVNFGAILHFDRNFLNLTLATTGADTARVSTMIERPPLKAAIDSYSTNFDDDFDPADLDMSGFSVSQPAGFNSNTIGTAHPYAINTNATFAIKDRVKISDTNSIMTFDEAVGVEPGDASGFWDFVIVEASKNNVDFEELLPMYDSNDNAEWLALYNSSTSLTAAHVKKRTIDLTGNGKFAAGDEIFIRFRFFSDGSVNGWGWAIDNLNIQKEAEEEPVAADVLINTAPTVSLLQHPIDAKRAILEINTHGEVLANISANAYVPVDAPKVSAQDTLALTLNGSSAEAGVYFSSNFNIGTANSFGLAINYKGFKADGVTANDTTQVVWMNVNTYVNNGDVTKVSAGNATVNFSAGTFNKAIIMVSKDDRVAKVKTLDGKTLTATDVVSIQATEKTPKKNFEVSFTSKSASNAIYKLNNKVWEKVSDAPSALVSNLGTYALFAPEASNGVKAPTEFSLAQNFPNPFNPTTTIKYFLPRQANVQLVIFNSLGQKVRTAVLGNMEQGQQSFVWDGVNDAGRSVSSGVYFYKLITPSLVITKKMVLVK